MSKPSNLQALDVLIVDDEADIRELVAGILSDEGYNTRTAGDSDSALREVRARRPALVILDIWLQGSRLDGLQVLDEIKKDNPDLPVLVISGHGNIETAVTGHLCRAKLPPSQLRLACQLVRRAELLC